MPKRLSGGFSLIEILIVIFVGAFIALGIVSAIIVGYQGARTASLKIQARSIATEKFEELKNMPYDSLATQSGTILPQGNIPDNQDVVKNGTTFVVNTTISYVDDPFDGDFEGTIVGKPQDPFPYDYKRMEVKITEKGKTNLLAKLSSDVSAKAAETSSNTGILSIKVIDSQTAPVPLASVQIDNTNVNPQVHITTSTDTNGKVFIPLLPPDENYEVIASLPGYSTERTYPSTPQDPNPVLPNPTILVQQVASLILTIDKVSTLDISAIDNVTGAPQSLVPLTIRGDKLIYYDPNVYKYTTDQITDALGKVILQSIEADSYNITASGGYFISSTTPAQNIIVASDTIAPVTVRVTNSPTSPTIFSHSPKNAASGSQAAITIIGTNLFGTTIVRLIVLPSSRAATASCAAF